MPELQDIMEANDFSNICYTQQGLGTRLSRREVELVLEDNNIALPLQNDVKFIIIGRTTSFLVFYAKQSNEFFATMIRAAE